MEFNEIKYGEFYIVDSTILYMFFKNAFIRYIDGTYFFIDHPITKEEWNEKVPSGEYMNAYHKCRVVSFRKFKRFVNIRNIVITIFSDEGFIYV